MGSQSSKCVANPKNTNNTQFQTLLAILGGLLTIFTTFLLFKHGKICHCLRRNESIDRMVASDKPQNNVKPHVGTNLGQQSDYSYWYLAKVSLWRLCSHPESCSSIQSPASSGSSCRCLETDRTSDCVLRWTALAIVPFPAQIMPVTPFPTVSSIFFFFGNPLSLNRAISCGPSMRISGQD